MTNTRAVATRSVRPAATDWTRPARTASTTVEHNDRPCHENKITGGWVFPPDLSHELRYTSAISHGTRPGERKTRLLLEVLRDREADVLRFALDLKVPATSNQAERDLRPAKVQQNISGRLTSEKRTQDRFTIHGYLSTAAKHGHNVMTAMRQAITGHPRIAPPPGPPPPQPPPPHHRHAP